MCDGAKLCRTVWALMRFVMVSELLTWFMSIRKWTYQIKSRVERSYLSSCCLVKVRLQPWELHRITDSGLIATEISAARFGSTFDRGIVWTSTLPTWRVRSSSIISVSRTVVCCKTSCEGVLYPGGISSTIQEASKLSFISGSVFPSAFQKEVLKIETRLRSVSDGFHMSCGFPQMSSCARPYGIN